MSDLRSAAGSDAANESVLEASTVASAVSFEDPLGALSQVGPASVKCRAHAPNLCWISRLAQLTF